MVNCMNAPILSVILPAKKMLAASNIGKLSFGETTLPLASWLRLVAAASEAAAGVRRQLPKLRQTSRSQSRSRRAGFARKPGLMAMDFPLHLCTTSQPMVAGCARIIPPAPDVPHLTARSPA
jgi:hypothetical protein